MSPIRVLLANQHPIFRANLRQVLDRAPVCRVIGEVANGKEAVLVCSFQRPDVVVLDFNLALLSGLQTVREIAAQSPGTRSIFVSGRSEQEYVANAFQAGASGFVLNEAIQEDLEVAVKAVANGNHFLSPRVIEASLSELSVAGEDHCGFDETDKRMLLLLAKGADSAELASALRIDQGDLEANLKDLRTKVLQAGVPSTFLDLISRVSAT